MGKKSPNSNSNDSSATPEELHYRSDDGLVEVIVKRQTARRFPQHDYPVVCLRLRGKRATRILPESDGVEALLTHREICAFLRALNSADGKAQYSWRDIAEKSACRKEFWRRVNANRQRH